YLCSPAIRRTRVHYSPSCSARPRVAAFRATSQTTTIDSACSTHSLDLPFIFGNFGANAFSFAYGNANKAGREALSGTMIASLAAFAKTGNPNTPDPRAIGVIHVCR
ncbi:carboxylesterase family protein, partial [Pseudomonas chlororaphis]|nr:carboxylesterase family protein [Pseudomonas chlororaphis]